MHKSQWQNDLRAKTKMMKPAPSCSPVRQRLLQLPWIKEMYFSVLREFLVTRRFWENSRPHLPWQCICRGSCIPWSHRRDLLFQHTGHLSNKEHRPDILLIMIFRRFSTLAKSWKGGFWAGSVLHMVSVSRRKVSAVLAVHRAPSMFSPHLQIGWFSFKSSPNVQRRKGNRVAAIIK